MATTALAATPQDIVDAWHDDLWRLVDHGTPLEDAAALARIDMTDRVLARAIATTETGDTVG